MLEEGTDVSFQNMAATDWNEMVASEKPTNCHSHGRNVMQSCQALKASQQRQDKQA